SAFAPDMPWKAAALTRVSCRVPLAPPAHHRRVPSLLFAPLPLRPMSASLAAASQPRRAAPPDSEDRHRPIGRYRLRICPAKSLSFFADLLLPPVFQKTKGGGAPPSGSNHFTLVI